MCMSVCVCVCSQGCMYTTIKKRDEDYKCDGIRIKKELFLSSHGLRTPKIR